MMEEIDPDFERLKKVHETYVNAMVKVLFKININPQ